MTERKPQEITTEDMLKELVRSNRAYKEKMERRLSTSDNRRSFMQKNEPIYIYKNEVDGFKCDCCDHEIKKGETVSRYLRESKDCDQ